ncbi:hypothetical protein HaLaN_21457 [Haematococcus lacustris]|uniref:Uncharacterized protein n=1 Tax=Haematococcus lacustris TaxID=44745 RepID=A0A699ZM95_HAELA|nr:hypothetical protein HaLaN_21457 [Haematococcus lacustris]
MPTLHNSPNGSGSNVGGRHSSTMPMCIGYTPHSPVTPFESGAPKLSTAEAGQVPVTHLGAKVLPGGRAGRRAAGGPGSGRGSWAPPVCHKSCAAHDHARPRSGRRCRLWSRKGRAEQAG